MLIEFNVENFRSFRYEQYFSMLSSKDVSNLNNTFTNPALNKNDKLLKICSLYGPNASGKSNLIKALFFMRKLVLTQTQQPGDKIQFTPFKLDFNSVKSTSKFKVVFIVDSIRYEYGFELTNEKIIQEYLFHWPKGRRSQIFERYDTNKFKFNVDNEEQSALAKRTLPNRLYLNSAANWNYEKVRKPFEWFSNKLIIKTSDTVISSLSTIFKMQGDKNFHKFMLDFLHHADIDIMDVTSSVVENEEEIIQDFSPLTNHLALKSADIKTTRELVTDGDKKIPVQFDFIDEESDGTKKMFSLSRPVAEALTEGKVLIVDELENSLHPMLIDYLIRKFNNVKQTKAQLIFTTHNTSIMSLSNLRRDQLWFIEKGEDKSSKIYSLLELKARKDENFEKGYLSGRYGALPFVDND